MIKTVTPAWKVIATFSWDTEKDKNSGRIATLKEQNVTLSAELIYMN